MSESSPFFVPVLILGFLVGFPLIWSFVCIIISFMSGWRGLASHFASNREVPGETFHRRGGRFGPLSNYSGSLNVTVGPEGVGLSMVFLYRPGHKAMVIPWDCISQVTYKKMLIVPYVSMQVQPIGGSKSTPVLLSGQNVVDSFKRYGPTEVQFEN